jgi:hypothetical protein
VRQVAGKICFNRSEESFNDTLAFRIGGLNSLNVSAPQLLRDFRYHSATQWMLGVQDDIVDQDNVAIENDAV